MSKVSYYVLYILLAVIITVVLLFFLGGDARGVAVISGVGSDMWQPAQTNTLLFLVYCLCGLAVVTALVSGIIRFVSTLQENPKKVFGISVGVLFLIILFAVTWFVGNGTPMNIKGYEGSDNIFFWLKLADMFLYSIYMLLIVAVCAIIFSIAKKKFS